MSHFTQYLSELKILSKSTVISMVEKEYNKIFEATDSVPELNEYFEDVKSDKVDKEKTLAAQQGNGRIQYRPGPGRGSLSYNPENPNQPAQNANTSGTTSPSA